MKIFSRVLRFIGAFLLVAQLCLAAPSAIALPAVITPDSVCTRDINQCGNPSICLCPDGYEYDAAISRCLISDISQVTEPGAQPVEGQCVLDTNDVPCTRDINPAGHSSICISPPGTTYNPLIGKNVRELY